MGRARGNTGGEADGKAGSCGGARRVPPPGEWAWPEAGAGVWDSPQGSRLCGEAKRKARLGSSSSSSLDASLGPRASETGDASVRTDASLGPSRGPVRL